MVSPFLFDRITIIGFGLIGSSIARAAKKHKLADTIIGCDNNENTLTYARQAKLIDVAMHDLATAVSESELVILSAPPLTLASIAKTISPALKKGAILMDTASVKLPIMEAISAILPSHVDYIPAHPIAGSEQSGARAGRADLFHDKRVIITPNEPLQDQMLQKITRFWSIMGARLEGVPPALHDMIYAHVSHLPHLLAYGTKQLITSETHDEKLLKFLRLRESNPELWSEIFLLNKAPVLAALDRYLDALWHIKSELSKAPAEEGSRQDDGVVREVLFPRIVASCLITTVMQAEKQHGFSFRRFIGSGFADFIAPASQTPEDDIEKISGHYLAVLNMLQEYILTLKKLREVIDTGNQQELIAAL